MISSNYKGAGISETKANKRNALNSAQMFNKSILKQILDYCLTIPGLLVISPIMIIIGILIKLESEGPIFFRQTRVGMNGRLFEMIKYRTMYANVDQSLHKKHILAYSQGELNVSEGVKMKNDPRVTRVGKFLRKTSLDELPQLFNVLRGEMSLVGPRPVPVYEVEQYDLWQHERLTILPGITGLWQVSGRSYVSFDDQLRLDIRYVRNQSLFLNIKILLLTIPAVLSRRGAE